MGRSIADRCFSTSLESFGSEFVTRGIAKPEASVSIVKIRWLTSGLGG